MSFEKRTVEGMLIDDYGNITFTPESKGMTAKRFGEIVENELPHQISETTHIVGGNDGKTTITRTNNLTGITETSTTTSLKVTGEIDKNIQATVIAPSITKETPSHTPPMQYKISIGNVHLPKGTNLSPELQESLKKHQQVMKQGVESGNIYVSKHPNMKTEIATVRVGSQMMFQPEFSKKDTGVMTQEIQDYIKKNKK